MPVMKLRPFLGFAAVTARVTNLIRKRLLEGRKRRRRLDVANRGIVVQAEVGNGGEEFAVSRTFNSVPIVTSLWL